MPPYDCYPHGGGEEAKSRRISRSCHSFLEEAFRRNRKALLIARRGGLNADTPPAGSRTGEAADTKTRGRWGEIVRQEQAVRSLNHLLGSSDS